ncbi:hypothetical protein MXB_2567, partial [Myxobolus squamalis]
KKYCNINKSIRGVENYFVPFSKCFLDISVSSLVKKLMTRLVRKGLRHKDQLKSRLFLHLMLGGLDPKDRVVNADISDIDRLKTKFPTIKTFIKSPADFKLTILRN